MILRKDVTETPSRCCSTYDVYTCLRRSFWLILTGKDDVKILFVNYLNDIDALFMYLSAYYNVKLYERESLLIFDEVQLFTKARAAIKFLIADGRYDYLKTSLLMSIKKT